MDSANVLHTAQRVAQAKAVLEEAASARRADAAARASGRVQLQAALRAASTDEQRTQLLRTFEDSSRLAARAARKRVTVSDFEVLTVIGRGAFGEVSVVRHRSEGGLFAMKVLRKAHMSAKNQAVHALSERNALAAAAASTSWIVRLHWSFQDDSALFLVMDLCSGGDFMSLLIREDVLPEAAMRFYAAEAICALEEVHALGFVHRDIKPDNLLLTATGHLRLTDLGLAARIAAPAAPDAPSDATGGAVGGLSARARLLSTVGTPDYLAPEVLRREGYDASVDAWSLGAICFEGLIGFPPFFADDPVATCKKVLHWKTSLKWPPERIAALSPEALSFVRGLLDEPATRLGGGPSGIAALKQHPWFTGLDWATLHSQTPPFVPAISSRIDIVTAALEKLPRSDVAFPALLKELVSSFDDFSALSEGDPRRLATAVTSAAAAPPITPGVRTRSRYIGYTFKRPPSTTSSAAATTSATTPAAAEGVGATLPQPPRTQ